MEKQNFGNGCNLISEFCSSGLWGEQQSCGHPLCFRDTTSALHLLTKKTLLNMLRPNIGIVYLQPYFGKQVWYPRSMAFLVLASQHVSQTVVNERSDTSSWERTSSFNPSGLSRAMGKWDALKVFQLILCYLLSGHSWSQTWLDDFCVSFLLN